MDPSVFTRFIIYDLEKIHNWLNLNENILLLLFITKLQYQMHKKIKKPL